jgi:PIN domain nuclease of toxin-antitoxin system
MKYLLDTVVWLWSLDPVNRLNSTGREIIENGEEEIYLSAATTWEISIKMRLGKLSFPAPPSQTVPAFLAKQGLSSIAVTHTHAARVYDLPFFHADPFDRLLIAQALVEGMTILTSDRAFAKYPVDVVWCGK